MDEEKPRACGDILQITIKLEMHLNKVVYTMPMGKENKGINDF